MSAKIILDDKVLQKLAKELPERTDVAVRATAFTVEARAKANADAFVDTGANRASIFAKTSKKSGYGGARTAAGALRPGKVVDDPTPDAKPGVAYVAPAMEYSAFLEFGTSRMAARPFIQPAVEQSAQYFVEQLRRVLA